MPSFEGPRSPATAVDDSGVGTLTWTNPSNVTTSDNVRATVTFSAGASETSHYIFATNFSFAIPAAATIVGIIVEIERAKSGFGNSITDSSIKLIIGGSAVGTSKGAGAWATSESYVALGNSDDTWGLTPTAAQVNASDFGVAISCACNNVSSGNTSTAHVDHVRITVYYVESEGPSHGTTCVDEGGIGTVVWDNPGDARISDDDFATCTFVGAEVSRYLKTTDFGFSIDTASTIDGVIVLLEKFASVSNQVEDEDVRLVVGGTITGSTRLSGGKWPLVETITEHGEISDLWGLSLTPEIVNDPGFGAAVACENTVANPVVASVDSICITVFYTAGEENSSSSSTSSQSASSQSESSSSSSASGSSTSSSSSLSSVGTSSSSSSISTSSLSELSSSSSSSTSSSSSPSSASSASSASSGSSESSVEFSSSSSSSSSSESSSFSSSHSVSSSSLEFSSSSSSSSSSLSSSSSSSSSLSTSSSSSLSSSSPSSLSSSSPSSSSTSSSSSSSSSTSSDIQFKPRKRIQLILNSRRVA